MSLLNFLDSNEKDIISCSVKTNLNRTDTARTVSNKDFDIEKIGESFVKLLDRVLPLTKHDRSELENIRNEAIELRYKLSLKMRELGIYSEVETLHQQQINRDTVEN